MTVVCTSRRVKANGWGLARSEMCAFAPSPSSVFTSMLTAKIRLTGGPVRASSTRNSAMAMVPPGASYPVFLPEACCRATKQMISSDPLEIRG